MNPRIARDIRLVQLPLITGIILMIGGLLVTPAMSVLVWMAACAIVVASVYVGDMVPNGLSLALTLPVPRSRLWREKTSVAAVALLVMSVVCLASYLYEGYQVVTPLIDVLFVVSLPVFFLGAGALISLWVRQAIATFWLLLLAGGGLFIFSSVVVPWVFPELNIFFFLCALFLTGGVVGLWMAAKTFARFEDTGDVGALGHIELGAFARGHVDQRTYAAGLRHLFVLAWKEIVLQQINIVLTAGIVIVIGAVALTVPEDFLMKIVWLPKLVSLLIAFVVGAVAFAEEERMGISSWILTFPAKRRTQFLVKMVVSVTGALVLSLIGVLAMDALMNVRAVANQFTPIYHLAAPHFVLIGLLAPLGACLGGGFTSSFSRGFLSALSHTLLTGMVLFALYPGFSRFLVEMVPTDHRVAPDAMLLVTAAPAFLAVFGWMSWRNFVRESTRSKAVTSYVALAVVALMVMVFNVVISQRAWELFEPDPARARFATAPAGNLALPRPVLTGDGSYAILRDGSLWCLNHIEEGPAGGIVEKEPYRVGVDNDWVNVISRGRGMFGLKSDGSLWMQGRFYPQNVSFKPDGSDPQWYREFDKDRLVFSQPEEVAPGTKWKQFPGGMWSLETIAIREDGTLWMWGQPSTNIFNVDLDGPVQMTQLSADRDWKSVIGRVALKDDGTLWVLDGRSFSALGIGKDTLEWGPAEVEIDTRFTELIPTSGTYGVTIVGRTTGGGAVHLGHSYYSSGWRIGCRDVQGVPVEPSNKQDDTPWFRSSDFVLTDDNLVLARNSRLDFGCAWVALSNDGGFTRDGSYWDFRRGTKWEAAVGLNRIAEWLHLSLRDDEIPRLIPPRWRPTLVGKFGE